MVSRGLITLVVLGIASVVGAATSASVTISASSIHPGDFVPQYAFDGNPGTRWASVSNKEQPQWLQVDFGTATPITGMTIRWERAAAVAYRVQVSDDAKGWQTIHEQKNGKGGVEVIEKLSARGRYLRIQCDQPMSYGLFSIWEVEFPEGPAAKALAGVRSQVKAVVAKKAPAKSPVSEEAQKRLPESIKEMGVEEIVFAGRASGVDGHWYANFGYYARGTERKLYGAPGGKLCKMNLKTGQVTALIDDPRGHVRDPQVHYDAKKIIFSWRKGESENYNLFEINIDGTGIKQLTEGAWDDIEPCYLPDGGIMFVSSRCKRWVNCWLTQVAVLYRCDADGKNLRQISANVEQDNTPWVLPDGRVLYQRWEYVDRSQVDYHHLWTTNPDGTGQMVYYGNMYPGTVMIDAKPIPGTDTVLSTFSPGHGQREHAGPFYVVDPKGGPDHRGMAQPVGSLNGRDPYPVSPKWILYASGKSILLSDFSGAAATVYTDAAMELHEPRPIVSRAREQVIAPRSNPQKEMGRLFLADVHVGRNMEGVKPGEIKKLLVLESLAKPINFTGGMDPLTYGGSFTLERVLGTVPVEADGSAYLEVPALRAVFFVALDEKGNSIKRMQSFLTVQPGETTGCFGCHEQRTRTMTSPRDLLATRRKPSTIQKIEGIPEVYDFPRDIQPILDKHCVSCHDYDQRDSQHGPRAGDVVLTGDRGPMFSHSYYTLTVRQQFADGRNMAKSNYGPRELGSSASAIMKKVSGEHYGVKLSAREIDLIRFWIESGAVYPGTYAALGTGMIGGYDQNNIVETDFKWPETIAAGSAIKSRCASCHKGETVVPQALSDEMGISFWRPSWTDKRLHRARHLTFNLSRPEKSLMLLAPLAKEAGGYGKCVKDDKPVFASTADADYQKILAMVSAGKRRLEEITRFDMPTFKPEPAYLREMKRYGVLPAGFDPAKEKLDVYELDQRYWESLWWRGGSGN